MARTGGSHVDDDDDDDDDGPKIVSFDQKEGSREIISEPRDLVFCLYPDFYHRGRAAQTSKYVAFKNVGSSDATLGNLSDFMLLSPESSHESKNVFFPRTQQRDTLQD